MQTWLMQGLEERDVKQQSRFNLVRVVGRCSMAVVMSWGVALSAHAADMAPCSDEARMCAHGAQHGGGAMPFMGLQRSQRWLDDVKATDAQRQQIRTILEKAHADMKAAHEAKGLHEMRQKALSLWAQPKMDEAGLNALRKEELTRHEQASQRMMQVMVEVGRVLTPEQRAKLAQDMATRHQHVGHGAPAQDARPVRP